MLDYFGVTIIHSTLTWTTGSVACLCDLLRAHAHGGRGGGGGGALFIVSLEGLFVESAGNLTPEKSQDGRKA